MRYTEVGTCSQGMVKVRGGEGAQLDAAVAALCPPRSREGLIRTQVPPAQHLPPHPHLQAPPSLEKPPVCLQQGCSGGQVGKERCFCYTLWVLQPLLLQSRGQGFWLGWFHTELSLCSFRSKIILQSCLFLKGSNLACQSWINSFHSTNQ